MPHEMRSKSVNKQRACNTNLALPTAAHFDLISRNNVSIKAS